MPLKDPKMATPSPYDSRVLSEDADSFTTHNNDTGKVESYSKNESMGTRLSEGFSVSDKMGQKLQSIRKQKGWGTSD